VLSVLDIGTGFHPDLTGRENVYLNGEILGMSRKEIDGKYKQIVDFSGIGEFIDRPVKQYSSGMYLRLAFSVVVTLDADLLLFDEVLSVGDARFRLRTSERMQELARLGRSIILVSHNMGEILKTCTHCIRLEDGAVKDEGSSFGMVSRYGESAVIGEEEFDLDQQDGHSHEQDAGERQGSEFVSHPERIWQLDDAPGNDIFKLIRLAIYSANKGLSDKIYMEDPFQIALDITKKDGSKIDFGVLLTDVHGNMVLGGTTMMNPTHLDNSWTGERQYRVTIPGNLLNYGVFGVSVAYIDADLKLNVVGSALVYFKVYFNEDERDKPWFEQFPGVVRPKLVWQFE